MASDGEASRGHARQLGRVLGIIEAFEPQNDHEAVVVSDVRRIFEARADDVVFTVKEQEFERLGAPEYRTLAVFCELANRFFLVSDPHGRKRLIELAEINADRVKEASSDAT